MEHIHEIPETKNFTQTLKHKYPNLFHHYWNYVVSNPEIVKIKLFNDTESTKRDR